MPIAIPKVPVLDFKAPFPWKVRGGGIDFEVTSFLTKGDIADVYEGHAVNDDNDGPKAGETWLDLLVRESDGSTGTPVIIKIQRDQSAADLMANERNMLRTLRGAKGHSFDKYIPSIMASFEVVSLGCHLTVNVIERAVGHVSLQTLKEAFPTGIDFRDAIWMWKRTLAGAGYAHENGIVHGAILPPHVMVNLSNHGAQLLDWSYATKDRVRSIPAKWQGSYPPEILDRKNASAASDIYLAAKCVEYVTDKATIPAEFAQRLRSCTSQDLTLRPSNAWDLYADIDLLAKEVIGPQKFRELKMPSKDAT